MSENKNTAAQAVTMEDLKQFKGRSLAQETWHRLLKNKGDRVEKGQPIARLYAQREELCQRGKERFLAALEVGPQAPEIGPMILERVEE